jgi:hypothetical protein
MVPESGSRRFVCVCPWRQFGATDERHRWHLPAREAAPNAWPGFGRVPIDDVDDALVVGVHPQLPAALTKPGIDGPGRQSDVEVEALTCRRTVQQIVRISVVVAFPAGRSACADGCTPRGMLPVRITRGAVRPRVTQIGGP